MKSIHSKNITPNTSNQSPFFQKGNDKFLPTKKSKPFFNAAHVQAKLTVNESGDKYEQEADSMADKVVQRLSYKTFSGSENNSPYFLNTPLSMAQRKCGSCEQDEKLQKKEDADERGMLKGSLQKKPIFESNAEPPDDDKKIQKKCAECEQEEKLLRKDSFGQKKDERSSETTSSNIESSLSASRGSGNPLPPAVREQMETSFGADFSAVKIHNDSTSVRMNESLNAQAFTHGSDIYFNAGKYDANHTGGKHLLAHELTHVVQQSGGTNIRKQEDTAVTNRQGRFLTDDSATPAQGQMTKSEFLQRLNTEVCENVDEALRFTGSSSDNCPYIREVFARYQNNTPAQIEAVLQRYEPSTQFAQSAQDLIQMVKAHAFTAAIQWAANGVLPGLSQGLAEQISSGISTVSNAVSAVTTSISNAVSSIGNLFFKSKPGGQSPFGVMRSLGKGNPINSSTRGRMESAFGTNFSDVQIHTDSKASGLSGGMNARAFTVGNHIAFGSGEHKPGTLVGDALMAHELAHVVQQKEESQTIFTKPQYISSDAHLENDADSSTYDFLMNQTLQSGQKKSIRPKMKSGLSIHSCGKSGTPCSVTEAQTITTAKQSASGWVTTALGKLRTTPVPADVLAALQKNFGATDGVVANLPGIITKITTGETEMTTVPISCAGTENSTCSKAPCGYTPGAGAHKYVICRNATLTAGSDPIYQAGCVLHEAFHSAFSDFSGDSYSGWGGHSGSTSGYPGSNPLKNADSYASLVIDLR